MIGSEYLHPVGGNVFNPLHAHFHPAEPQDGLRPRAHAEMRDPPVGAVERGADRNDAPEHGVRGDERPAEERIENVDNVFHGMDPWLPRWRATGSKGNGRYIGSRATVNDYLEPGRNG